jgi:hypothetical protein
MHVRIARTSVPLGLLVLLFVTSGAYLAIGGGEGFLNDVRGSEGWFCGPCLRAGTVCGEDAPTGETCCYNWEIYDCTGYCTTYCPHGPENKYCAGIIGRCTQTLPPCNSWHNRQCKLYMFGGPRCACNETTGGVCGLRGDC